MKGICNYLRNIEHRLCNKKMRHLEIHTMKCSNNISNIYRKILRKITKPVSETRTMIRYQLYYMSVIYGNILFFLFDALFVFALIAVVAKS